MMALHVIPTSKAVIAKTLDARQELQSTLYHSPDRSPTRQFLIELIIRTRRVVSRTNVGGHSRFHHIGYCRP